MHHVTAKAILSAGNGMNLTRGCLHGCIYCDARSACYQMDHPFEDVALKENALELLEAALRSKRKPCMIGTGAMSDPYIPIPESLELTRGALGLIYKYGFGVSILTKSDRILRDLPLLEAINDQAKAVVQMTLTTWDDALCRKLEPGVCPTSRRLAVLEACRGAGIPTVVWLAPILPHLTDTRENVQAILEACIQTEVKGVVCFGMGLTLREGNREYFYAQLDRKFPGLKERYIREYGNRYECLSPRHGELEDLFHNTCERAGMLHTPEAVFGYLREFPHPEDGQLSFL